MVPLEASWCKRRELGGDDRAAHLGASRGDRFSASRVMTAYDWSACVEVVMVSPPSIGNEDTMGAPQPEVYYRTVTISGRVASC
jgi:hypothetical protein